MPQYRIIPTSPSAHIFSICLKIDKPNPNGQVVCLPAWILGSYMIRDFSKNIVTLKASSNGSEISVEALDKQTWRCDAVTGALQIDYDVYAWDLSVRSAHLDQTHGYFNGTSVFLKVLGQEEALCGVTILKPLGDEFKQWKLASTLSELEADEYGFGLYTAANYEELVDHPVEMGDFSLSSFEVAGVRHEMVYTGRFWADLDRISKDVEVICAEHISMFGELPTMDKYQFQTLVVGDGYGGLEHKTSTSLMCKRNDLLPGDGEAISDGYRQFLGLCSHEYFHLWNVKRIQPDVFKQADLTQEVHTRLLWAFEGITSYYDELALLRTQRISVESYLELLAQTITRVMRGAGRLKQHLEDSSFYTWNKFYKQDENAPNSIVSYYAKGALVALLLDLRIRSDSHSHLSLDDVMRYLWENFGAIDKGVPEEGIEQAVLRVTGKDYSAFFAQALRSCDDLPLLETLTEFGIGGRFRMSEGAKDKGGQPNLKVSKVYSLGLMSQMTTQGLKIKQVLDNGAGQLAGLSAGDTIVAMNQLKVTDESLSMWLAQKGEKIHCHVFRRDELYETTLTPQLAFEDTCDLWLLKDIDHALQSKRAAWLHLPDS